MTTIILLFLIIAVVATFSAQNATPVAVSFLSWHFEASLAVVIVLSLLVGIVTGMVLLSWIRLKRSMSQKKSSGEERSKVS
jgi:putative membrane protein